MGAPNANSVAIVPAPERGHVYQMTVGTTKQIYQVPSEWKGRYVKISASAEAQFHFSDTADGAPSIVLNQASGTSGSGTAAAPYVLTAHNDTGDRVGADGESQVFVRSGLDRFSIIAAEADTEIFIRPAGA